MMSHGPSRRIARREHHSYEARAPVIVIRHQQVTECQPRRVNHKVGERKPALYNDGGIGFALRTLDNLWCTCLGGCMACMRMNTKSNKQNTYNHIQSYTSKCQKRKHTDMLCVVVAGYPTAKQQPKSRDNETENEHLHKYLRRIA